MKCCDKKKKMVEKERKKERRGVESARGGKGDKNLRES